jgi:phosphoglycerate dehydrogenase-like enzyme
MSPLIFVMENWGADIRELMTGVKPEGFDLHFWNGEQAELDKILPTAKYIMVEATALPGTTIRAARNLKMIQKYGTGVEKIDVATARELGIPIYYTPGANSISTAEMAVTLMLATYRRLCDIHNALKAGRWMKLAVKLSTFELYRKTVGIVGVGDIGSHVAKILSLGFGCNVIYNKRNRLSPQVEADLGITYRDLDDLLKESDIVSLHLPLTAQTRGIIGARELSLMKPSAILINSCRGTVVDEGALIEALRSGKIAAAGLDVFEKEPPAQDNPLLKMDNVVLTPHCGGGTRDGVTRVAQRAFDDIERFEKGQPVPERDLVK